MISTNNNYISYPSPHGQVYVFFNDRKPAPLPPPGGAVFRRPEGRTWRSVSQIMGEFSTEYPTTTDDN